MYADEKISTLENKLEEVLRKLEEKAAVSKLDLWVKNVEELQKKFSEKEDEDESRESEPNHESDDKEPVS